MKYECGCSSESYCSTHRDWWCHIEPAVWAGDIECPRCKSERWSHP